MRVYSEVLSRWVTVPDEPKKIVSLAPAITETLFMIGLGDSVVGVSRYCNKPPEARSKPKVGAYLDVNLKLLKLLDPDLVLVTTGAQRTIYSSLEAAKVRYFPIPLPVSVYGVIDLVITTSMVVGRVDEGRELAEKINEELHSIKTPWAKMRAYYEVDLGGPVTIGAHTFVDHALRFINLENIMHDIKSSYVTPNYDLVAERNPGVIIVESGSEVKPDLRSVLKRFEAAGLTHIDAVRRNRVVLLEHNTLSHYGPSLPKSLRRVAEAVAVTLGKGV